MSNKAAASENGFLETINPCTGEIIKSWCEHTAVEIENIISNTRRAFLDWKETSLQKRADTLMRLAELLESRKVDLARLMAVEMGKPLAQGISEIEKCVWVCRYYAENGAEFQKKEIIRTDAGLSYICYQPLGVIFAVMPWNFPFWQLFRFAAPAVMAGNAFILKHSPNVTGCALMIKTLFQDAGFPPGLTGVLLISEERVPEVSAEVIADDRIKAVTLTGSVQAGRAIAAVAGAEVKKCVLELGGSDPAIILEDADLIHAARISAFSRLINAGQNCIASKRFRPVPHRHWVWSIPKMLRLHFLHHRKLLPKLCRCAWDSLTMFFHEALDRRDVFPGGILVPQTFGGMANWNPHVHALITDTCWDREGNDQPMPDMDIADKHGVEKLFASLVFKMLLEEGVISEELVENMRSWKHSGFSVYCAESIEACDANGRKTLSEYISRAPFSLERMSFNEGSDTVLYRGEHFHPTLARNFDVSEPLEWIARITSHIPKKGAKQVIYYGVYSQAWRGREHRQGISPKASGEENSVSSMEDRSSYSRRRRQLWAVLLKKVWDVDALKCPKCGGQMKVISFIEQPSVIRRILKHLDLWEDPRSPPVPLELVCEPCVDYVPWKDDVPEIEVG